MAVWQQQTTWEQEGELVKKEKGVQWLTQRVGPAGAQSDRPAECRDSQLKAANKEDGSQVACRCHRYLGVQDTACMERGERGEREKL